jgi:hypothetical protein
MADIGTSYAYTPLFSITLAAAKSGQTALANRPAATQQNCIISLNVIS